ncbi:MAG TPA: arginine deiminase family protein [Phycisphaerae bacterium]|nr:arginine deiminase family protein [Phycisphaerae bacterium]
MLVALTREVSGRIGACELTHLTRQPIDVHRARSQHAAYERTLENLRVRVERVGGGEDFPDGVFIEDTAVVVDEMAVITRPGAPARRGETECVAEMLGRSRTLVRLAEPAMLDGGDVLCIGKRVWVGQSARSNVEGIRQLAAALGRCGYRVEGAGVRGCLHLKSAVTAVGEELLVMNPAWVNRRAFAGLEVVEVDPAEAMAANALRVGQAVLFPEHFPGTAERLERRGVRVIRVACDELAKAEGALTCCSLLFRRGADSTAAG